jgi:hypothetical protein
MKDICTKNAPLARPFTWRLAVVCSMLLLISGCGKDSGDGEVINVIELPAAGDLALNLYCADFGLFIEDCVLDDPDNPYAFVSVNNDNKFDLNDAATSLKAKVYLWATALARDSTGENQVNTAKAMYALSNASCSELIQDQAQRAYRSVLDNYLTAVTFFSTNDFGAPFPEVFYPFPVKILTSNDLRLGLGAADPSCDPAKFPLFFSGDPGENDFEARVRMFEWGFLYDDVLDDVNKL